MHPRSIGEHIKKRRMDLKLLQREAADRMGISPTTLCYWESSGRRPEAHHLRAVHAFLGLDPYPAPDSMMTRLAAFRNRNAMSAEDLARILGIKSTTLARWERGATSPTGHYFKAVKTLLAEHISEMSECGSCGTHG